MNPPRLQWSSNHATACWQFARDASFVPDSPLFALMAKLQMACAEERVPAAAFLDHVVPLSFSTPNQRELAERALVKTIGRAETGIRLNRFHGLISDIMAAAGKAMPLAHAPVAPGLLRSQWQQRGAGLLAGIAACSEPGVLVESADIVLIEAAAGIVGRAYLPYNLVCIADVAADKTAELPEVVRLAWLLSLLNLEVPRTAEQVRLQPLATVAALAMLPLALKAAESLELAHCNDVMIGQAVAAWLPFETNREAKVATLCQWWDVYQGTRPSLAAALAALDQLLTSMDANERP